VQTEKLYGIALDFAGLTGTESVWDLYCGIGTISLFLSQKARQVYGVEIVPQAIADAKDNAKRNGVTNVEFFVGKAEEVLPEFYERESRKAGFGHDERTGRADAGSNASSMLRPDVIVVDPPRKGCDEKCLDVMLKMQPERIVYVSCDSATLVRDLKLLCEGGYEIRKIQAVDQFPQGVHVETIVKLSQRKPDDVVEVDLDLDELDITSAETKATYNEIKQYVLEQTGLRVTNLYIAQVKQKCGIIERENYNKPKSENSKQPKCTPEKEVAILDALKHFNMI
jgi:23S rRNA (uracil1939-C5)-methyltransferase